MRQNPVVGKEERLCIFIQKYKRLWLPIYPSKAPSYCAVTTPRARSLKSIDHATDPVLEKVRELTDSVAVWEEVPATGTVAVVVKPWAEDEVGSDAEEGTK